MENFEENCVRVTMKRRDTSQPWGFRMTGGRDLGCFLHIAKVNPRSLSARFGLRAGDRLVMIEGLPAQHLNHGHAKAEILRAGNDLHLIVQRGAVPMAEEQDPMANRRSVVVEEKTEYRGDDNPTSQSRTFYLLNQFLHEELEALPKEPPTKAVVVNGPNLMAEHGPVSGSTYTSANRQPPAGITVQLAPAPTMAPGLAPLMATMPVSAPKPVSIQAPVPAPKPVSVQAPVPGPKPVLFQAPVPAPKPVPGPKSVPDPMLIQGPTLVQGSTLVQRSTLVQGSTMLVQSPMQAPPPPPPQPSTAILQAPAKEFMGVTVAKPAQAPPMKLVEKPATVCLPASQTVEKVAAVNVQVTKAVAAPATVPVGSVMMSSEVVKETAPKPAEVKGSDVVKETAPVKAEVKSSDVVKESATKLAEVMSSEIVKEIATKPAEAKSSEAVKEIVEVKAEATSSEVVQEAVEVKAEEKSLDAASLEAEADSSDVVIEVSPEDIQDSSTAEVKVTEDTSATESVNIQVDDLAPVIIASAEEEEESFSFEISAEPADAETNFSMDLPAENSVEVNESADVEEPFTIVAIAENNEEDAEVEFVGSVSEGSDEPETTFTLQL